MTVSPHRWSYGQFEITCMLRSHDGSSWFKPTVLVGAQSPLVLMLVPSSTVTYLVALLALTIQPWPVQEALECNCTVAALSVTEWPDKSAVVDNQGGCFAIVGFSAFLFAFLVAWNGCVCRRHVAGGAACIGRAGNARFGSRVPHPGGVYY